MDQRDAWQLTIDEDLRLRAIMSAHAESILSDGSSFKLADTLGRPLVLGFSLLCQRPPPPMRPSNPIKYPHGYPSVCTDAYSWNSLAQYPMLKPPIAQRALDIIQGKKTSGVMIPWNKPPKNPGVPSMSLPAK